MDINWDAVGAIAELLGALGVIATLLYLIRQISQNTAATRSAAAGAYWEGSLEIAKALAQDPVLNKLFFAYMDEPEKFDRDEEMRAHNMASIFLHAMEQARDLYIENTLSKDKWEGRRKQLIWLATKPGFKRYWDEWRAVHNQVFTDLVDECMQESPAS